MKENKFYTRDNHLCDVISDLNNDVKYKEKIMLSLNILGKFENDIELNIYDKSNDNCVVKLWCEDTDGRIFIINPVSNNKDEKMIIEMLTDNNSKKCNLKLLKNAVPTMDNIILTQFLLAYNFKFGRFITDNQNFFNIFMGDNVCYVVNVSGINKVINQLSLIERLNEFMAKLSFNDYVNLLYKYFDENNITFETVKCTSFKDFEIEYEFEFESDKRQRKI